MPIKFRCKHCNQLMGIARRKAGTDVTCPTCNGVLRVPFKDSDEPPAPVSGAPHHVFEHSDFDEYLEADLNAQPIAMSSQPAIPTSNRVEVEPALLPPAAPPGIMLSNGLATLLTIGIIFLMALSFSLGLLVGRAL